jgi:hypothetical protein
LKRTGCVFCGGTPLTLEHAVPAWCRETLSIKQTLVSTRDVKRETRTRDGWQQTTLDVKVRDVCASCNNGWMGALESRAARAFRPLITSSTAKTRIDLDLLATWGTKTVLTCNLLTPDSPLIRPWQYGWFYKNQRPFQDSAGWLGAFDYGNPFSISSTDTGPIGSGTWRAVVNIGALVFMVWVVPGSRVPRGDKMLPPEVKPWLTRVYPRWRRTVSWPPRKVMGRHDLHVVAGIEHDAWDDWTLD